MGKPFLFMTHVSYAGGVRKSAQMFDCASMTVDDLKSRDMELMRWPSGSSLLAASFNDAWCKALNMQEEGVDIRWFVMLHDDVVPEPRWVTTLLEDLDSSGADMVSALIPLKDPSGCTSTAISGAEGNPYKRERRITLKESMRLPPVFTKEDCQYPDRMLLANTGCWICRFDRPWIKEVDEQGRLKLFFTINDQVIRDAQSGKWVSEVEPEDWFFSRKLQELGGKIAISTRVKLQHWGLMPFPNYPVNGETWGEKEYDYAHGDVVNYKPIGEKPVRNMSYESKELGDVKGYMNDDEGHLLAKYAEGKRVLEIGSYYGRSTIFMARTAKHVTAIDTWDTQGTGIDTLDEFNRNVERHGLTHKIDTAGGTLRKVKEANGRFKGSNWFNPDFGPFDLIFIDANHDFAWVIADAEEALPLLADGGYLAFHDYDRPTDPGVTKAVDLLIKNGATVVDRAGSVIIIQVTNARPERLTPAAEATFGAEPELVAAGTAIDAEFTATCSW